MGRGLNDGCGFAACELAPGLDKLCGMQLVRAFVALVTSCIIVAANGAGTLDVSICKEFLVAFAVELVGRLCFEIAVVVELQEDILADPGDLSFSINPF